MFRSKRRANSILHATIAKIPIRRRDFDWVDSFQPIVVRSACASTRGDSSVELMRRAIQPRSDLRCEGMTSCANRRYAFLTVSSVSRNANQIRSLAYADTHLIG